MANKILFILKRREDFNPIEHSKLGLSTGLFNSANFMNDMLKSIEVESNIEVVIDNNSIDKIVNQHKPTHVIIEALWVVPSKFTVLCKLHPNVKWIIRLHSEIPFLAGEGMAMDWLGDYASFPNVCIATNSPRALNDVKFYLTTKMNWSIDESDKKVIYLPNYYPQEYKKKEQKTKKQQLSEEHIDISCFGAVRPLKNHLMQALASIKFANSINKKLRFHINSGRTEMKGQPIVNNLQALFTHLSDQGHELIQHDWAPRSEFLELCAKMDLGLQVSLSETFNIVAADIISQGVAVIGSKEIPWMDSVFSSYPNDTDEICKAIEYTYKNTKSNVTKNQKLLKIYTTETRNIWEKYFK